MYCQHFSLEKKPFQISSDNSFLWLGPKHASALNILKKGIAGSQGLLTLTGDVGTGKTTLIHEIIHTLPPHIDCIKIPDPCLEMHHLFLGIAQEFGFAPDYEKGGNFSSAFFSFLESDENQGKKKLIIVDEAQRIPKRFLKELIAWSDHGPDPILTILLVGQLEFCDLLESALGRPWQRHIPIRAELLPLDEKETKIYINKRLELAGGDRNIFLMTTIEAIHKYTDGIPRLINIACDQTLITAFAKDIRIVDVKTFKEATGQLDLPKQHLAKEQTGEKEKEPPGSRPPQKKLAAMAAVCICLFLGYFFFTGKTADPPMPEPYSPPTVNPDLPSIPPASESSDHHGPIYPVPKDSTKGLPPLLFSSAIDHSTETRTKKENRTDLPFSVNQNAVKPFPKKEAPVIARRDDPVDVDVFIKDVFALEQEKDNHGQTDPAIQIAEAGKPDQDKPVPEQIFSPRGDPPPDAPSQETDPGAIIDWIIKKKSVP